MKQNKLEPKIRGRIPGNFMKYDNQTVARSIPVNPSMGFKDQDILISDPVVESHSLLQEMNETEENTEAVYVSKLIFTDEQQVFNNCDQKEDELGDIVASMSKLEIKAKPKRRKVKKGECPHVIGYAKVFCQHCGENVTENFNPLARRCPSCEKSIHGGVGSVKGIKIH